MKWLKPNSSITPEKYYLEIDEISLYNWSKCMAGDLKFVTKDLKPSRLDGAVWVKLFNDYLKRFGITDDFDRYLDTLVLLTALRVAYIQTGDEMVLNQIAIEEVNAAKLDPSQFEGMTPEQCLTRLSKWQGYHLKAREISIVEFKNLMIEYGRTDQKN